MIRFVQPVSHPGMKTVYIVQMIHCIIGFRQETYSIWTVLLIKAYTVMQNGQITFFPVVYAVVTNDQKCSPKEGMHFCELRGASENFTKELKNDFDGVRVM